jgi:hypothetical protein
MPDHNANSLTLRLADGFPKVGSSIIPAPTMKCENEDECKN